ncbi:PDZ domain-containing protein [Dioscorea alata]|uniref:PDZ domain-containing protein n=1 Tax=Dioscorea alata TaxID=55571 RepID=A0ACB7U8A4_DIOAL|nr:PDZ domain-containing protein [Dioscorea alata]
MPEEEWDETMPLPGDIIEAVAAKENQLHRPDSSFLPANGKSELSSQLGQLHRNSDLVWLQVRRGNVMIKLQARIVIKRESKLHRKYTVQALGDERHVAILDDLTLDECANLQEMSRKVINVDTMKLNNKKSIKYDWRKKAATHLPDHNTTIISSILFVPFPEDGGVEKITGRSMAWFSAAVSSGVPLVFVNIQTEEISIDLVPITLAIMLGETRFGMDIKRTEEGFMFISSVSQGTAAERAGLGKLWEEASESGHLVVISRLEEKSLIPSSVTTNGLIQCCDHASIKLRLAHTLEDVHIHVMAWSPTQAFNSFKYPYSMGSSVLLPPHFHNI